MLNKKLSQMNKERKLKPSKLFEVSEIFEKFVDKHKHIEETGHGTFLDGKKSERDIDIRYKEQDYVVTIRRMEAWDIHTS